MAIKSIRITNYRAFLNTSDEEQNRYTIHLREGNNLLIYGENGSGKSSLFNALRDFISSSDNPRLFFSVNRFYEEEKLSDPPSISLRFNDAPDTDYYFSRDINQTNTPDCTQISKGHSINGFLSYRELLKLHFHDQEEEIDYFSFFFGETGLFAGEVLLTPLLPQNNISFRELWTNIKEKQDVRAIEDYNINAADLIARLEVTVNRLLSFFGMEMQLSIHYADASSDAGLRPPKIHFGVSLFGKIVPAHHGILNEARLTSIAISVYLAYLLSLPEAPFKFLFLDDIFIGLDTSNRLPLLDILSARDLGTTFTFRDFQIFITTYDREWFELAKKYLQKGWEKIELYVDDYSASGERPFFKKSDTYRERAESHLINGDYPAAANYLRKAFESELYRILPSNILYPGIPDSSDRSNMISISKSHFEISQNTDEWLFNIREGAMPVPTGNRFINLSTLITKFESFIKRYSVPYIYLEELQMIRNRLLNPLSHDNIKAPIFKQELIRGLTLLDDICTFRSEVIIRAEQDNPVFLNAMDVDYQGVFYSYRFEVLENIRYLKYRNYSVLINGKCRSIERKDPDGHIQKMPREYPSLSKICKGIRSYSVSPEAKSAMVYDRNFEFNVFNDEGKTLTELINEQN